jgi:hypothetical protein
VCWLVATDARSSVSQTVSTIAGHKYSLTFSAGNDPFYSSAGTALTVLWNGTVAATITTPGGGASAMGAIPISPAWSAEHLTLTATSATSALEFAVEDASMYDIVALTDVVLLDQGSSTNASSSTATMPPSDGGVDATLPGSGLGLDAGEQSDGPCPGTAVGSGCAGRACSAIIDDMTGPSATNLPFPAPSCASPGFWFASNDTDAGTIATPSPASPYTYSPLPDGPPSALPGATLGACMTGVTSPVQYVTSREGVVFAPSSVVGDASALPAIVDASSYQGVQFWLWEPSVAPDISMFVALFDKNSTKGWGICNPAAVSDPTSCYASNANLTQQVGWQLVQLPWSSFVTSTAGGNSNEATVDPHTLTALHFRAENIGTTGGAAYNYCVLELSFY